MTPETGTPPMIKDYITGEMIPDVGAEANRQALERHLVEKGGYRRSEILVNTPIRVAVGGQVYTSRIDLVVRVDDRYLMAVKCAAGSLDSRQREIQAAARILTDYEIPLAVASDGRDALVWETHSGDRVGNGLAAIPDRIRALNLVAETTFKPVAEADRQRAAIVFRAYDMDNVNVAPNLQNNPTP